MPLETIATAMPRRRTNQCEMSVISGPNVAALPKTEQALRQRKGADAAGDSREPVAGAERDARRAIAGMTMPKRSASRPMTMPPMPKPNIVSVNGSDASPRAMPKSACTAGSATTKDHMPTLPMVPSTSATASRIQAIAGIDLARRLRPGLDVGGHLKYSRQLQGSPSTHGRSRHGRAAQSSDAPR